MTACVPPDLLAEAAKAEQRKNEAIDRLLFKLAEAPPIEGDDDLARQLRALIAADERKDR